MSLQTLLRPRSIAIVGVSRDAARATTINGSAVLDALVRFGYAGPIHLVHPEAREIGGRPAYPSIAALPEATDLIVIALSAAQTPAAIAEAGARGIGAAVIMSAGFAELGAAEGERLERELLDAATRHGVRICGPNALGYANVTDGIYAGYYPCLTTARPKSGGLGIVSHSGAIGNSLLARAIDRGIGLSCVIAAGNETNVALAEYVEHLVDDPATRVIAVYMEGVASGTSLRAAFARAAAAGKPVVVYKVGKSQAGAKAALSHTAKVAGEPELYRGFFRQSGVIEAARMDDLLEIPMLMLKAPQCLLPNAAPARGIGIVTISGGLGAIVADHVALEGFDVSELAAATRAKLAALPLKFGSTANPVDTTAAIQRAEDLLGEIIPAVAADPAVDAVVFPNAARFPHAALNVARIMVEAAARTSKPLVSLWYGGADNQPAMRLLHDSDSVACFEDPAAAARALAAIRDFQRFRRRTEPLLEAPAARGAGRIRAGLLDEVEGKAILAAYGIGSPPERVASDAAGAVHAAEAIGFPVALKIVSPDVPHKAKAGGVVLGLGTPSAVREAFASIRTNIERNAPGAAIGGVLVSKMVAIRAELLVGAMVDPALGPALVVGSGGGAVEALRDVAMCLLPATAGDCRRLLDDLRDPRLRALGPRERDAIAEVIARIAAMAADLGQRLQELDVNPIALTIDSEVLALDALFKMRS